MAAQNQNVCRYFKFGFCKYTDRCKFMHVQELCGNPTCDIRTCKLRHPRICKYYRDYKRCKFSEYCAFKHIESNTQNSESTENILEKIDNLTRVIEEKDIMINKLLEKMKAIEERLGDKDVPTEETVNETELETCPRSYDIEVQTEEIYKCEICDFETKKERGLNIHKRRKHGQKLTCDLCDETFETKRDLKMHRSKHSYSSNKYETENKCNKCDFESTTIETMEVHIGKHKVEYYECGLCDVKFENLDRLKTHLISCEIY